MICFNDGMGLRGESRKGMFFSVTTNIFFLLDTSLNSGLIYTLLHNTSVFIAWGKSKEGSNLGRTKDLSSTQAWNG
jgi:hypothetical protein